MRRTASLIAALIVLGVAPAVRAFCRQTTHDDDTCGVDPGVPLTWPGNCVEFSIYQAGSQDLPLDTVEQTIRQSFVVWHNAARPGEQPCTYLKFLESDLATCDSIEYVSNGGNMNVVVFRESGWVSVLNHAAASMGLTTVLFDPKTGQILSADMELNGEFFNFTVTDENADADLRNTVTHEAGHMIGLAHSPDPSATMYGSSTSGETLKRDLQSDDIEAVCAVYPVAEDPGFCSDPPGGLDTTCARDPAGCGCHAPGLPRGTPAPLALLALGAFAWRRRLSI